MECEWEAELRKLSSIVVNLSSFRLAGCWFFRHLSASSAFIFYFLPFPAPSNDGNANSHKVLFIAERSFAVTEVLQARTRPVTREARGQIVAGSNLGSRSTPPPPNSSPSRCSLYLTLVGEAASPSDEAKGHSSIGDKRVRAKQHTTTIYCF